MKIIKHSYELVKVTEGLGVSGYTIPATRVTEPYVLAVKGAKAVYEVNADSKIAPVSTTNHVTISNDGKELDGDYETYAERTTAPTSGGTTIENVKTYDYGDVKLLLVCVTYVTAATGTYLEIQASEDGTTWTPAFSDNSTTKKTAYFIVKARYLKWVNKNDSSSARSVKLYELETYDFRSQTAIVSNPDEFDCIIHEAQRKTAADGSKWYTLVIEPHEGLAFDYSLYKLNPVREYYKVTII